MTSKKQVRRVAAWIYAVVNPIIDSLQRELLHLERGNLTWSAATAQCEMIHSIQEYVESNQWPNYQDFLAEHPKSAIEAGFRQHDLRLIKLNAAAGEVFSWLISSEQFIVSVRSALDVYERHRLSPAETPSLSTIGRSVPTMAAEYLINNAQTLPSHYLISAFWNSVGCKMLANFRDLPEFGVLHKSRGSLVDISRKLKQALESYRLSLSRRYDMPAAPVPGISFES